MFLTVISSNIGQESFLARIPFVLYTLLLLLTYAVRGAIAVLLIKALLKYLREKKEEKQDTAIKRSLGEILKEHRLCCSMTQEFVAEALGVSRQAVSKWENGTSDPSTSNLLKLADLFGVTPEELIRSIRAE